MDRNDAAGQFNQSLRVELVRVQRERWYRSAPMIQAYRRRFAPTLLTAAGKTSPTPTATAPPPFTSGEPGGNNTGWLLQIGFADRVLVAPGDISGCITTAVRLLRTVFEDHYVDPENDRSRFFSGKTMSCGTLGHDFSVTHRGDAVLLSDFTWRTDLPSQLVSLVDYTRMVTRFAASTVKLATSATVGDHPNPHHKFELFPDLVQLLNLAQRFVADSCRDQPRYRGTYQLLHGWRKQPLQLEVHTSYKPVAGAPWAADAQIKFGPINRGQLLPMRLNGGPMVIVEALGFDHTGVHIALYGLSARHLHTGDRLTGIQLFYD